MDEDSDSVRDMLTRGVAAAKSGDKDEARFLLEWALEQPDASPQQRAEAWLWLSEVFDVPARKRECLEQVLELDPANPLARRGMAILDGRLDPRDIVDPSQPVAPVVPAAEVPASGVRRYRCPQCGGQLEYTPDRRALACAHCGHHMWEYDAIQQGLLVQEQDFVATLPTARAQRWELAAVRTLTCQGCGASLTLPPAQSGTTCPFCASAHVVVGSESRELIEPDGVLPFAVGADDALARVHRWLAGQRFRPDDLPQRAQVDEPRGVYLPFWTFDVGGQVGWSAMVPEDDVDWQGRREVRWVRQESAAPVDADDLLVPASRSLPPELFAALCGQFDTRHGLAPYAPELLARWPAEIYQVPMADASLLARERVLGQAKHEVDQELGLVGGIGARARDLTFNSVGITILSYKLALLPVWVTGYRYHEGRYALAVNGQTGDVSGDVPRGGVQKVLAGIFGRE